jgi:hypothetical protein
MNRFRTGWRLARASWAVLRKDGSLAVYPAVALAAALVSFWAVAGVGIAIETAASTPWLVLPFLLAGIYAAIYWVVYFNVALAAAAQQSIEGHDTGLRDGLRIARMRRGIVAKWALLELTLGLVVSIIGALLNQAGARAVARLISATAGLVWPVATFFVIPAFAFEGVGPRDALARSVDLIRSHWGESIVGRTGIGAFVSLIVLPPVCGLAVLSTEIAPDHPTLAGAANALFTVVVLAAIAVGSALSVIFRVEVYRWATAGELGGGFTHSDVLSAFRSAPAEDPAPAPTPAPAPGKRQLEHQLDLLADSIGDTSESDRFWSDKVRRCADQVRAGKPRGLNDFLGLFGGMGSINDQPFSAPLGRQLSSAHALASALLRENDHESSDVQRRKVNLRPWTEGYTGKAAVYGDGTVVTTVDVAPGTPSFADIAASDSTPRHGAPSALMGISPDGACDVYGDRHCDERWLVVQLQDHHPALHLGPPLVGPPTVAASGA